MGFIVPESMVNSPKRETEEEMEPGEVAGYLEYPIEIKEEFNPQEEDVDIPTRAQIGYFNEDFESIAVPEYMRLISDGLNQE